MLHCDFKKKKVFIVFIKHILCGIVPLSSEFTVKSASETHTLEKYLLLPVRSDFPLESTPKSAPMYWEKVQKTMTDPGPY